MYIRTHIVRIATYVYMKHICYFILSQTQYSVNTRLSAGLMPLSRYNHTEHLIPIINARDKP